MSQDPAALDAWPRAAPPTAQESNSRPAATQDSSPVFAVVDVETTGLSPHSHRILEIAVVRLTADGSLFDQWSTRINPEGPVGATHIHGITDADVADSPRFSDVSGTLAEKLAGHTIVAHNATFDVGFITAEYERAGWDVPALATYCTLEGSRTFLPILDRRRLADCCLALDIKHEGAHSALGDARATAEILNRYLQTAVYATSAAVFEVLVSKGRATSWPEAASREPAIWTPIQRARTPGVSRQFPAPRPKEAPLLTRVSGLSLVEVLDEGAPAGTLAYLETLLSSLEDGELSETEVDLLDDVASLYSLSDDDRQRAHRGFVLALAHRALDDGRVSRDEREDLQKVAALLGVPKTEVRLVIDGADRARAARLSLQLSPLPDDWALGDPVRPGDKVVFTGCDASQRAQLEKRAEELGVRIMNTVSKFTCMLITDDTMEGTKAARAAELGLRKVHPDDFDLLLSHIQPALPKAAR